MDTIAIDAPRRSRLPLRTCVGIALFNSQGKVWIGRRCPKWLGKNANPIWQMPQGGISRGETAQDAAFRELYEETGIVSAEIIDEIDGWLTYELPQRLLGRALKGRYRGQRQRWFAMRFTGKRSEIDLTAPRGKKAEFDAWRWEHLSAVPGLAVSFKRPLYRTLLDEFAHIAR
jgi:putative (di)nucleoside polyphosphate hydrolase